MTLASDEQLAALETEYHVWTGQALQDQYDAWRATDWKEKAAHVARSVPRVFGETAESVVKFGALGGKAVTEALWKYADGDAPSEQLPKDPDVRDMTLWKAGQAVGDFVRDKFPNDPRLADSFWLTTLPEGFSSMGAFMLSGALTGGGALGAAGVGVATSAIQQYEDARAHGADEDTAMLAAALALPSGASEALPIGRIFNRFDKASGGTFRQAVTTAIKNGAMGAGEEAFQEAVLQQLPSNAIAKMYDENRELADGLLESGGAGGIVGAVMNFGASLLGARRAKSREIMVPNGTEPSTSALIEAPSEVIPFREAPPVGVRAPVEPLQTAAEALPGPPFTKEALLTPEGAAAFVQTNPEGAQAVAATKGSNLSVRRFEESGVPIEAGWTRKERVQFRDLVREAVSSETTAPARVQSTEETADAVDQGQVEEGREQQYPQAEVGGLRPGPERGDRLEEGGQVEEGPLSKELLDEIYAGPVEEFPRTQAAFAETAPGGQVEEAEEPVGPPPGATSIKNAVVDEERKARGLRPAMEPARQSFGDVWDEAMKSVAENPMRQEALIAELKDKPRAVEAVEDALLLHRQVELQNEYDKTLAASEEAVKAGDDAKAAELDTQEELLSQKLLELYDINKAVGTATSRGLAARKMLANEDFTLARMLAQKRKALAVSELSPDAATQVREAHKKIAELQKQLDEHVARIETLEAEKVAAPAPRVTLPRSAKARANLEAAWKDLEKRFPTTQGTGKLSSILVPFDPEFIASAAKFAKALMKLGVATVEDFIAAVVERIGQERAQKSVDALRAAWDQAIAEVPQKKLEAYKKSLRTRIAGYQTRQAKGDFAPRTRQRLQLDKEAEELRFQLDKAKADFHRALEADRRKRRSVPQKVFAGGQEVLNTARVILTSMDFSAVLRQGGILTFAHPIRSGTAIDSMFRAFFSERGAAKAEHEIAQRRNAPLYKRAGLSLTTTSGKLSQQEEAYMSSWARKLPLIAGSERAYVTFLNRLRADSFDALTASLGQGGSITDAQAKVVANFVNVATGRGDLGRFQAAAVPLATVFFAPKYVTSRFQFLLGQPFYRGDAKTRGLVAKEYARAIAGLGLFYGMSAMALKALLGTPGDDDEWNVVLDPRSSDFAKIRIGKTRIDPLFGLQQATVLLSRLATGESTNLHGKTTPIRGEVPYGGSTSADVIGRFLRTKLSPVIGGTIDLLTGKNVIGEPVTPLEAAKNMTVPITMRSIYEAMLTEGAPKGAALGLLDLFGMGIQSHMVRPPTAKELPSVKKAANKVINWDGKKGMRRGDDETFAEFQERKKEARQKKAAARERLGALQEAR